MKTFKVETADKAAPVTIEADKVQITTAGHLVFVRGAEMCAGHPAGRWWRVWVDDSAPRSVDQRRTLHELQPLKNDHPDPTEVQRQLIRAINDLLEATDIPDYWAIDSKHAGRCARLRARALLDRISSAAKVAPA